jgi:hypothetical protein
LTRSEIKVPGKKVGATAGEVSQIEDSDGWGPRFSAAATAPKDQCRFIGWCGDTCVSPQQPHMKPHKARVIDDLPRTNGLMKLRACVQPLE